MCRAILFLLITLPSTVLATDWTLGDQTFEERYRATAPLLPLISEHALRILKEYPPKTYFYVGVGRSPTPVMALIEVIIGDKNTAFLPMSNAGKLMSDMRHPIFRRQAMERLTWYYTAFLPPPEFFYHRKILVIDFVKEGATLEAATQIATYLFSSYGFSNPVEKYAIEGPDYWDFDIFAPYGYFDVNTFRDPPAPNLRRPEYDRYKNLLRAWFYHRPEHKIAVAECEKNLKKD